MNPLLAVRALKVCYGKLEIVHGVSISVSRGEIVALVGANGAGKSTTLAAICGLLPASSGCITFLGEEVNGLAPETLSRRGMALSPEGRRVFASLTVAENLRLGGAALPRAAVKSQEDELLDLFPILRSRYRQKAGNLSGGEQQMLAIARSLMSKPKLLLLDEPSLGLAPKMVDSIFALIAELRRTGLSILLVEQNVARALEVASLAFVLVNGEVVLGGPARELEASDLVRQAYLGV